jgi:hypothetical protein
LVDELVAINCNLKKRENFAIETLFFWKLNYNFPNSPFAQSHFSAFESAPKRSTTTTIAAPYHWRTWHAVTVHKLYAVSETYSFYFRYKCCPHFNLIARFLDANLCLGQHVDTQFSQVDGARHFASGNKMPAPIGEQSERRVVPVFKCEISWSKS